MLTLNQTIKLVNNFAVAHLQVNSFGEGEIQDFATSGVTQYPAMWVDYENPTLSLNEDGGGVYHNTVRCYLGDRLLKSTGNLTEVLSDSQSTLIDLIAYLQSQTYLHMTSTILDKIDYVFNQFMESFEDDEIAGYYVDLNFKSSYNADLCQIPFTSGFAPTNFYSSQMTTVDKEVPTGTVNGTNTVFTLAHTPGNGTEYVYMNGQLLTSGVDYTLSGASITFLFAPQSTDRFYVTYRY